MKIQKRSVICMLAVAAVLLCLFALPQTAQAASTSDLTFKLNSTGDGYIVSDCKSSATGALVIPATYNGKPVTSIGEYAFSNCTGLTSITIPNSVTAISVYAFYNCKSLTSFTIPDSVTSIGDYAFEYCTSLTSITIPDSVTSIGKDAFYYCRSLTSVTIPDSVTSIGSGAFYYCTGLTSITIPDSVTSIGGSAFSYCTSLTSITIPSSVTSMGDYAFSNCTNLTNLQVAEGNTVYHSAGNCIIKTESKTLIAGCKTSQIPSDGSVTSIGSSAFYNCTVLTSITIPDSVTSIGSAAFRGCTGLTSITIPDSVTSIGSAAFRGCTGLTSIQVETGNPVYHSAGNCIIETESKTLIAGCRTSQIPSDGSVTSIGDDAFHDCTGLTSITIPDSVTSIGYEAFYNCYRLTSITIPDSVTSISYGAFSCCNGLTSITIPDSVTSIGRDAFSGCTKLTSVTIGDGVTSIGFSAFCECRSLTSVTIPDSVTSIGGSAFYECSSLTSITIPDSVTSIGDGAFQYCSRLTDITIPDSVTGIGDYAFSDCTSLTSITIPDSITSIDGFAFYGCYSLTKVTYCGTQKQWDAIKKGSNNKPLTNATLQFHNYEKGACTICGATQELTDANLKFYRANASSPYGQLKLTGEVIAYVTAARKGYDSYYVVFTYDNQGNTVTVTAEPSSSSDANYVLFDCAIPAPLMTADITATVYGVKGGVAYEGETIVFTIRECVDAKLNMWYANYNKNAQIAKLFDTLVNLLNYGAQAQTRFGVNTDKLATDGLPETYAAKIKTGSVELNAYPSANESGKAATLYNMSFKLQAKINMYGNFLVKSGFTAASDYTVKIVHTKADGSSVTYTIDELSKSGNYLYFEFSKLAPAQMRDELQITLYKKGVAVSATYIRSGDRVVNTLPAALSALANAIMHYSDCAKAAFG